MCFRIVMNMIYGYKWKASHLKQKAVLLTERPNYKFQSEDLERLGMLISFFRLKYLPQHF